MLYNLCIVWDVCELNVKWLEVFVGFMCERVLVLCKVAYGVDDFEVVYKVYEKNMFSFLMMFMMVLKLLLKNVGSDVGVMGGLVGWYNLLMCGE